MENLYFKLFDEHVLKSGPKTAILLQVGVFFEVYDSVDKETGQARTNVQALAELCGCSVEPKPSTDPTKTRLFWGFPDYTLPKFERILVAAGYTVVVFIQNKDATGVVESRTLDHVASPGTYWDGEGGLAIRRDEQILLSVYIDPFSDGKKRQWYVGSSAFDVMTGKASSAETCLPLIDGKPVLDTIQPFWAMYPPAEVIVYWCSTDPPPSTNDLQALFMGTTAGTQPMLHIRILDPKDDASASADRLRVAALADFYKRSTALAILTYLDLEYRHYARRSLAHLLQFMKDHNPSYLASLHSHTMWSATDTVLLGNAALEQLAMTPSHAERPHESLLYWLQHATTPMGRRTLRERCLKPIADISELTSRQERIANLRNESIRHPLENHLRGMSDLPRLYRRFQLKHGTTDDLLKLLTTYEKAQRLAELSTDTPPVFHTHIQSLLSHWDPERIRKSRSQVSDPIALGSYHPWRRGVHADLDACEDEWDALEKSARRWAQRWEADIDESDIIAWTLNEDAPFTFQTTERRAKAIETVAKNRYKQTVTYTKRGSSTKVTLTCDKLEEANAQALIVRRRWKALAADQWAADWALWMDTAIDADMLDQMAYWIGTLDTECTLAALSNTYGYVRPSYTEHAEETNGFSIQGLRHPIIERLNTGVPYISHNLAYGSLTNDASTTADTANTPGGILLYGVNAAGKSSLGKALGLAIVMAQCGMPVPATSMTLVPYTRLFTRILGNDNLWAGMSSFVVEMTEFRSILRSADNRTLVIGDELCAGTETASATAIVAAGVQTLAHRQAHFFFATHLHELADINIIKNNPAVQFYHLTVRPDPKTHTLMYDRKLRQGCGSPMYGLEVCKGLDMDTEFIDLAFTLRKQLFSNEGAKLSPYNARVAVTACEVCGERASLETHHIVPQAAATPTGHIGPGVHKNVPHNLVALCDECHQKHHRGELEVKGWVQTTEGRRLHID